MCIILKRRNARPRENKRVRREREEREEKKKDAAGGPTLRNSVPSLALSLFLQRRSAGAARLPARLALCCTARRLLHLRRRTEEGGRREGGCENEGETGWGAKGTGSPR